jgi:hypothetical protein
MKRSLALFITLSLMAVLSAPEVFAKKSRSSRSSSRASASRSRSSREVRGRSSRGREARGREVRGRSSRGGRYERASRYERSSRGGRYERASRGGRLSRQERREVARNDRGGRYVRERVVEHGRHGRRVVRYRYVRQRSDYEAAPVAVAPRPTGGGIPSERVTEIQNALIKAGFLQGPASGQYDETTIQAMKQFQGANGFPQTGTPSAPALKKLGVAKRSNDGFAVPVNNVSASEHKPHSPQSPE